MLWLASVDEELVVSLGRPVALVLVNNVDGEVLPSGLDLWITKYGQ